MTVEKCGDKWCVLSCHHDPGKVLGRHDSKAEADAQHHAIMSGKSVKKMIEIDTSKL